MRIIHGDKGFHLEFFNGLTLSIQYGAGNYCENRSISSYEKKIPPCPNFEMAVIDKSKPRNEQMLKLDTDTVFGWVPFTQLTKIIELVSNNQIEELRTFLRQRDW
jgi:hypothetical protein